jgi:hypothetical protein
LVPIGIITRNRHAYLDVTLRSLSATRLPDDQALVLFDDATDDRTTLAYLYEDRPVDVSHRWPRDREWLRAGLDVIESRAYARGMGDDMEVIRLGNTPLGVVNASCAAARFLIERYGYGQGIVLLQDDVVFTTDWLESIVTAAGRCAPLPPGLIAGMRLNVANPDRQSPTFIPRDGLTAQCYYLTAAGLEAARAYLYAKHRARQRFDDSLCEAVRRGGLGVYVMYPPVCQHFGIQSLVRPEWDWRVKTPRGRIDLDAAGPFVLSDCIRPFAGRWP